MHYSPIILCFFIIQTILVHGCFQSEREALLEFRDGVSDPSGRLASWRGEDCCTWDGIRCSNQTGHVFKLNLSISYYNTGNNSLSGKINPSLLALVDLKHLDLSNNNFTGHTFPLFISSFRNLKYLNLQNTGLSGNIPSQFSNLSKLYHLDLSYNDLSGIIPSHLSNLSKLYHLDLSSNDLSGIISPQLGNLSRLQYLSLDTYYSSTNPPIITNIWWLSHLTSLKYLSLYGVNLLNSREWVQALNMLPSLEKLYLMENNLTIIPPSLSAVNFSSLTTFKLGYNNFNTLIPDWIGKITSLKELMLLGCSFNGPIPNIFHNMNSLNVLSLIDYLEGPVPLLHNLHNLTSLFLVDININEDVSELVSKLSNETLEKLEAISLRNTSLTGNLTGWLNKMPSLQLLSLEMNKLNGTIPAEIGNLTNLYQLILFQNSFVGEISETHLAGLPKLEWLDLSSNSITITIESNWVPSFQLFYLDVSACELGSKFPSWFQNQTNLYYIGMSNTGIDDNIPDWFWNLSSITYIYLSHNNIRGKLPQDLCTSALTSLSILDLSNNNMSGDLPKCWPNTLQIVNLGNNKIASTIPSSIGSLSMLIVLQLNNNDLIGELPSSLQLCKNLIIIDLGENKIYDQIPGWLGETLPNLTILILRSNLFFGNIPSQLAQLNNLQLLDLSNNNISGLIPNNLDMLKAIALPNEDDNNNSTLSKLDYILIIIVSIKGSEQEYSTNIFYLKSIDLSRNNIMGEIPQSITALLGLTSLNLSYNNLNGIIPKQIGNMQSLESLDFRMNELSGLIPYSLANLNFLTTLNFSYNNLSGEIPTGNQLQTLLDPYIYVGNPYLCGSQISKSCNTGDNSHDFTIHGNHNNLDEILSYFFMVLGFGFGFWAFFGVLTFKRNWRCSFFQIVDGIFDQIYVFVIK